MYAQLKKFAILERISGLEVVNLGTGMGYYDFRYEECPVNAFNFSMLQQNLYFDYQLLKKYSDKMKKDCIVCVVLPYFIFCAEKLEDTMQRYARYYALLPEETVVPYCNVSYEEWVQKRGRMQEEGVPLRYALESGEMERQTAAAIDSWKCQLKIISFDSGEVSPHTENEIEKSKQWLGKILEYCRQAQLVPVIIVPPMSQTLLDRIGMGFRRKNFYDILAEVVPEDIRILDYTEDAFFCNPGLYGWPGFLAEDAAKIFTKDVLAKLGIDWRVG